MYCLIRTNPPPSHRTQAATASRSPNHPPRTSRSSRQTRPASAQPTADDVDSYIQELADLSEFFNGLDELTSGDLISYKVAGEVLDLDDDSMNSYLEALSMKAKHLSGIRKFLDSNRNVARADLLRELLDDVEPKCRRMRDKLSRLRSSLVTETSRKPHAEAQVCDLNKLSSFYSLFVTYL